MVRFVVVLVGVVSIARAAAAAGVPSPSPSPAASAGVPDAGAVRAKDAGTIEGDVVAVDYRTGTIVVQAGSRRIDVVILPSTNIAGDGGFHTIADIRKGTHVRAILSRRADTYIAQIIHLR